MNGLRLSGIQTGLFNVDGLNRRVVGFERHARLNEPSSLKTKPARVLDKLHSGSLLLSYLSARRHIAQIPHSAHVLMFAQMFGQMSLVAAQNVDHTGWHVRRVEDLVEVEAWHAGLLVRHYDSRVAVRNSTYQMSDEREQWSIL